jgi:hypothetical protein
LVSQRDAPAKGLDLEQDTQKLWIQTVEVPGSRKALELEIAALTEGLVASEEKISNR